MRPFFSGLLTVLLLSPAVAVAQAQLAPAPAKSRPAPAAPPQAAKAAAAKPAAAKPAPAPRSGYQATGKVTMTETITAADYKHIEGGPLLLAAYAVVWLIFFAVLLFLFVRVRRVAKELRQVEARVAELPEEGP